MSGTLTSLFPASDETAIGRQTNSLLPPRGSLPFAQPPDLADAYTATTKAYGGWLDSERESGVKAGLIDPESGWPTANALLDAAHQYGSALIGGTSAPGMRGRIVDPRQLDLLSAKVPKAAEVSAPVVEPAPASPPIDLPALHAAIAEGQPGLHPDQVAQVAQHVVDSVGREGGAAAARDGYDPPAGFDAGWHAGLDHLEEQHVAASGDAVPPAPAPVESTPAARGPGLAKTEVVQGETPYGHQYDVHVNPQPGRLQRLLAESDDGTGASLRVLPGSPDAAVSKADDAIHSHMEMALMDSDHPMLGQLDPEGAEKLGWMLNAQKGDPVPGTVRAGDYNIRVEQPDGAGKGGLRSIPPSLWPEGLRRSAGLKPGDPDPVAAPAAAEPAMHPNFAEGSALPPTVYRGFDPAHGNEQQSSMANGGTGGGVYVSTSPAAAGQWGDPTGYPVHTQPKLLDLGNWNGPAKATVARYLGVKPGAMSRAEFDEGAADMFIKNEGTDRLKQNGFDGYRMGQDAYLLGNLHNYAGEAPPAPPPATMEILRKYGIAGLLAGGGAAAAAGQPASQ